VRFVRRDFGGAVDAFTGAPHVTGLGGAGGSTDWCGWRCHAQPQTEAQALLIAIPTTERR